MKNLIIQGFSLRDWNSRRALPALRQFVPRAAWHWLMLLALWVTTGARAATYYADYAFGADTNDGTTTGTAWKHCPGDAAATDKPDSTTLAAGDTVYFKGGVIYSTSGIMVNHSGTEGNVITLDGTGSIWGTGKAVLDGNYQMNGAAITLSAGASYVTLTGFELRNFGGYADNDPVVIAAANGEYGNSTNAIHDPRNGYGVYMSSGSNTNIYLANLYLHHLGIWHHTIGWDGRSCGGVGIYAKSPQSLTITNCEFTKIGGTAFALYATVDVSDVLMTDCYIHDDLPTWGIDIAPQAAGVTFSNVIITKTRLVNIWSNWSGTPDDPNGTKTTAPHQNYIFLRSNGTLCYWTNMTVSRCLFLETNLVQIGSGGSGAIHANNGTSFNAYNNIFCRPWSYNGIFFVNAAPTVGMTQVVRICNNTIQREMGAVLLASGTGVTNRSILFENNLVTDWTTVQANGIELNCVKNSTPVADYNIYWHPLYGTNKNYIAILSDYVGAKLFPGLQNIGLELHGKYADPQFTDATNDAPALRDFHPLTNSPAVGAGANLRAYFTTDYSGNTRPLSGPWTIGAFEGGAVQTGAVIAVTSADQDFGTVFVGATTNRTFTVQNTGDGTLTGSASVAAPFSIVSGGSYSLAAGQDQTVTVSYGPTAPGTNAATVAFSGGGGASATLTATAVVPPVLAPAENLHQVRE